MTRVAQPIAMRTYEDYVRDRVMGISLEGLMKIPSRGELKSNVLLLARICLVSGEEPRRSYAGSS